MQDEEDKLLWRLTLDEDAPLRAQWTFDGAADCYEAALCGGEYESHQTVTAASAELPTDSWPSGLYTLWVTAQLNGEKTASASMKLQLTFRAATPRPTRKPTAAPTAAPDPTATPTLAPTAAPTATPTPTAAPTDTPSPSPMPSWPPRQRTSTRGRGSGSSVFVITPGKALISTHASGTGDMTAYGTVSLVPDEDDMRILSLGGQALEMSFGGEETFRASVEDTALRLTADTDGTWYFTQYALQVLARSGVTEVRFESAGGELSLPTDLTLSGFYYGRERSGGFVGSDFLFSLTADSLMVQVEDRLYAVEDGQLTVCEQ